jgi:hypothetical protein
MRRPTILQYLRYMNNKGELGLTGIPSEAADPCRHPGGSLKHRVTITSKLATQLFIAE